MLIKFALFTALSLAVLQPLASGPSRAQDCEHFQTSAAADDTLTTGSLPAGQGPATEAILLHPGPMPAGDILGGRGPEPHARELTQIAIYASIGNKDGVAMLAARLRASGVSREAILGAIGRINVHAEAVAASHNAAAQSEPGWDASQ